MYIRNFMLFFAMTAYAHASMSATSKYSTDQFIPTNWTFALSSENYISAVEKNDLTSDNIFILSYRLSDQQSLTAMMAFTAKPSDSTQGITRQDMALQYAIDHGKFSGGLGLATKYRMFLPISELSEELGKWQFRFYATATKQLSKLWTLSAQTQPRLYGYTSHQEGQLGLKWVNTIKFKLAPNDIWSSALTLGHAHYNRYAGATYKPTATLLELEDPYDNDDAMTIKLSTSIAYKNFALTLFAQQERDLRSPISTSLFADSETMYFAIVDISI